MYYAKLPDKLKEELEQLDKEFKEKTGFKPGTIFLVREGKVIGGKEELEIEDYIQLIEEVPSYRGELYQIPQVAGTYVELSMTQENGSSEEDTTGIIRVYLLSHPVFFEEDNEEGCLLLCEWKNRTIQVKCPMIPMGIIY